MSGVSESELVLKDSLPFQVKEVFLIHKENGLLLSHVSLSGENSGAHQDVVSGMLTAISDFAASAFDTSGDLTLSQIEYQDLTIYLETGHHAYLAVVYAGVMPQEFVEDLKRLERKLHRQFANEFRTFSGEIERFKDGEIELRKILQPASGKQVEKKTKTWPAFVVLGLFIIGLIYGGTQLFKRVPQKEQPNWPAIALGAIPQKLEAELGSQVTADFQAFRFIYQEGILTIRGNVQNEQDRLLVATKLAEISAPRIIVNDLQVETRDLNQELIAEIEAINIQFELSGQKIKTEDLVKIDRLAKLLQQVKFDTLRVIGYTDNTGTPVHNQRLSLTRAQTIKKLLVEKNLPEVKIVTIGKGAEKPLAANETPGGRSLNRRVELRFGHQN